MRIWPKGRSADESGGSDLVAVAFARDVTEAELIQGLLSNAGIASMPRPAPLNEGSSLFAFGTLARGFGGGQQQVLVHANRADEARQLLAETLIEDDEAG
ncbi:MAG TPA: DUF2007 domain-containing protein [Solirubrobacterales bacterium]|nr:DUF2007 domain-containing protein [Solirubrobacterales bacterium]